MFNLRKAFLARVVVFPLLAMIGSAGVAAAATIRIGVPERDNIQYLTLWTALGAGYFEREGLAVQLVFAPAANQIGQLLLTKQADIALLQPPIYLGLIAQQRPIVLFASLLANDPINLVVRSDVAARLKLDASAPLVERLKALKGLRIGVANEPPRRLRVLFALAGMDADRDIQMKIVRAEEQIAAYTSGAVDALYTHTPFLEDALVAHGALLLVNQSAGEVAPLSNGEIHSLAAMKEYADAHPEVLAAVTRAIAHAERLLHTDSAAAAQALLKAGIRAPSPQHLATIVDIYRAAVPATPRVSAAAVVRDATLYPARPSTPDFTRINVADFLAPEFADAIADYDPSQPFDLGTIVVNAAAPGLALSPLSDTIDQIDIRNRQALTVNQAIEYLPGVAIDHKAPRNQTGISIGGFDSRQVPLYLDGIPAYLPFDGYVDLTRYLTSDIGAIQVVKAYATPLLGPNGLGGIINLVTRQPQRFFEGDLLIGTAPGGQLNSGVHVGARQRRSFFQASADRLQSDSYPVSRSFAFNAVQPGGHRVNSSQRDHRYRVRAGWTPRSPDSYVVTYSSQRGVAGVPPYSGQAPLCAAGVSTATPCVTPKYWKWPEWNADSYYFNSATAVGPTSSVQTRAFYSRYTNTMDMFDDATYSTMNVNASSGNIRNRDHSAGVSGEFDTRAVQQNALGASFFVKNDTHVEQATTFSRANVANITPAETDRDRQSSFGIHDAVTLSSRLRATLGVSADHLNGLEAQDLNSDRTGVIPFQTTAHVWAYNPVGSLSFVSGRAGAVLISYAHKSRFPTIKDRYSYKAGRAVPNPSLRPERARTWTGSYSRTLASRTVAQLDVFRSSVNDEIENVFFLSPLCPAAGGGGSGRGAAGTCQQAVNVGSEIHDGFTVTLRTTPEERLTIDANYSYLRREITGATGVFPTGTPKNKMVATATLRLPRDATALISTRYQDGTVAMSDNGFPLPAARFTTIDAGGTFPIRSSVNVQSGIKNLLDRDYYYWEGFPEPGRNWYLTLRYGFSRR